MAVFCGFQFSRADWAAYLLAATTVAVSLMITWRLLRDYLDKERALTGIAALMLVPLFAFLASSLNANTVMMPFWVAAQLFYLRARRDLGIADAILAGAFVGLTFLGKYWAIYLIAGMAITSFVGSGTGRSGAPPRRVRWTECRPGRPRNWFLQIAPSYPSFYGHQRDDRPTVWQRYRVNFLSCRFSSHNCALIFSSSCNPRGLRLRI